MYSDVYEEKNTENYSEASEILFQVSAYYGSWKTKLKFNSLTQKVSTATYGFVPLQECKNTEFVWELEQFCEGRCK